jgi:hypothetical protein
MRSSSRSGLWTVASLRSLCCTLRTLVVIREHGGGSTFALPRVKKEVKKEVKEEPPEPQ